jgi:Domain of unknown function DUF29
MIDVAKLYETDYYQWAKHQAELLQKNDFLAMDIEHLIEELEGMARSDKRELESRLTVLITHLLKWNLQSSLKEHWQGWEKTIIEQRTQLESLLDKMPSLHSSLEPIMQDAYPYALKWVIRETRLSKETFPSHCPYSVNQLLDHDFYPTVA